MDLSQFSVFGKQTDPGRIKKKKWARSSPRGKPREQRLMVFTATAINKSANTM